MKRRNGITIALVIVAAAIVAVFGFFVRIAPPADMVAALDTAGMTCGTCGKKIAGALLREAGVASVGVDVAAGRVLIGYDSKKTDPAALAQKVSVVGYRSTVIGRIPADDYTRMTGIPVHKLSSSGGGGCGGACGK